MNLVTGDWIPVIEKGGAHRLVSLNTLYQEGKQTRDFSVNPAQRIALMRLLICITQAALDGPKDDKGWLNCKAKIADSAIIYLRNWRDSFGLFSRKPFLQVPGLSYEEDKAKDAIKPLGALDCRSPFGGSCTPLFDHTSTNKNLIYSPAELALNLLTLQNFSTGGKVGQGKWNGVQYNESTFAAPCTKALHTFIRGENIIESIFFNLLSKNGVDSMPNGKWGKPLWEYFPDSADDLKALSNASQTYLGRLVPFSRLVNLVTAPGYCIIGPPPKSFRIEHLPSYREPSTTIVLNKKDESYYFSVSSSKHVWRDLGAVLAQGSHSSDRQGALALNRMRAHGHLFDKTVDIWVGGLELGTQAAKLSDFTEWNFTLPLTLLNTTVLHRYELGIQLAQRGEFKLRDAVKAWHAEMSVDAKQVSYTNAQTFYWSELDRQYEVLLNAVNEEQPFGETWYPIVRKTMNGAFEYACPHSTPRQIQAFAKAKQEKLRLQKPEE